MEAWIEIVFPARLGQWRLGVASLVEAWIEIIKARSRSCSHWSLPSRKRGLKYDDVRELGGNQEVASFVEMRIKIFDDYIILYWMPIEGEINMVERNIIIAKAGGTAGKNSVNYKISLPAEMVRELGITAEDKSVVVSFEGGKIIIEKKKKA